MTDESPKAPAPQSPFVSHDEMIELTGYKNHSAQARWLDDNDFHFVLNISGRPMVHRAHLAFRMGVPMAVFEEAFPSPRKKVEPNLEGLMKYFESRPGRNKLKKKPPPVFSNPGMSLKETGKRAKW